MRMNSHHFLKRQNYVCVRGEFYHATRAQRRTEEDEKDVEAVLDSEKKRIIRPERLNTGLRLRAWRQIELHVTSFGLTLVENGSREKGILNWS